MINKRPHILKYSSSTGVNSVKDANGHFTPGASGSEIQVKCRAEANGSGRVIPGQDNISVVYSWVVYFDVDTEKIEYGKPVQIFKDDELIASGSVKMFERGQMNARLWL